MVPSAFSSSFLGLVAWLYYLSSLLLAALTLFIFSTSGSPDHQRIRSRSTGIHYARLHHARMRRTFLLLALSLLLWQLTLFLEVRTAWPAAQLWLGRLNFTAIVFASYLALRFVQEVSLVQQVSPQEVQPQEVPSRNLPQGSLQVPRWNLTSWGIWSSWTFWLRVETGLIVALTLFTPLVDAAEHVEAGQAITTFGPLFPCYLVHVVGYLAAALAVALRERRGADNQTVHSRRVVRSQLTLISSGMLATGGVALVTNAVLPYGFGDFRWCDIGALSTVCFVLTVAYATFVHRLFALRVVVRKALVHGLLLAFVLGVYSSTIFVVTQVLTEGAGMLTQFVVLLLAFSFDPLRRFLEEKTDRLLFGQRKDSGRMEGPVPREDASQRKDTGQRKDESRGRKRQGRKRQGRKRRRRPA